MASPIERTSHLNLRVSDLARSRKFYADALGFAEIGTDARGRVLMSADPDDTAPMLVLEQAGATDVARPKVEPEPFIGMEHFAFELEPDDFSTLQAAYRRLKEVGAEIHHTVNHLVTNSIYFLDPDRNMIEVYINAPRADYADKMDHPYASLESLDDALEGPLKR